MILKKSLVLKFLFKTPSQSNSILIAICIVLCAFIIQWYFYTTFRTTIFIAFYPAVFFASLITGDYLAGFIATVLSIVLAIYGFAPELIFPKPNDIQHTSWASIIFFFIMGNIFSYVQSDCRKIAAKALQQEREIRTILDESAIITVTDREGKITFVNDKYCELTGYSKEELIGNTHKIVSSSFHTSSFYSDLWKTISEGKVWRGEICNKKKNGEIYYEYNTITPIQDAKGNIIKFIAMRLDITEKKIREKELIEKSKLTALLDMANGMAHEIKNPLQIIIGIISSILSKSNEINLSIHRKCCEDIMKSSRRISEIISTLEEFSNESDIKIFKDVELKNIIHSTLNLCYENFKVSEIDLKVMSIPQVSLRCQYNRIVQALWQLLTNSRDAILPLRERWINIDFSLGENDFKIIITDSGKNIPKEISDKMKTPFFTTKSEKKHLGLGLSIADSILRNHGGNIEIDTFSETTKIILVFPIILISFQFE
ncbi:PAS domain S-box protein [Pigmentibacter ruber]|uniref:PAS domain-containing sensor histidine kinase n=1 Tax=Pigmentibacter ruber TaxID=2683196 RepID=UPI00131D5D50|nr:PAS domain-containing sensor histidine kinase [Pigmentibacter ruber]BFD31294.1 hypothetical protein GTC16762_09120 [Pigmentibacter ruber]